MNPLITFIIPVRHQANTHDWTRLQRDLSQTLASIYAQTNPNWRAVVVANEGAELPVLPPGCEICRVAFPSNSLYEQGTASKDDFQDAVRLDKGRRVLSGMLHARNSCFFMVVDHDDLINNFIVEFVSRDLTVSGWEIKKGYMWGDGGKLIFSHDDFSTFCGTSLIIRSDLFHLPPVFEDASSQYIKEMAGSHIHVKRILSERGTPLAPLPFHGAIYRVGHPGTHSASRQMARQFLFNKYLLRRPMLLLSNISRLRLLTTRLKVAYFGASI